MTDPVCRDREETVRWQLTLVYNALTKGRPGPHTPTIRMASDVFTRFRGEMVECAREYDGIPIPFTKGNADLIFKASEVYEDEALAAGEVVFETKVTIR